MINIFPVICDFNKDEITAQINYPYIKDDDQNSLNIVINFKKEDDNNFIYIDENSKSLLIEKYSLKEFPDLTIKSDLTFKLNTFFLKNNWELNTVTKKNFSYFFEPELLGDFTQNSIFYNDNHWSINSLNMEVLYKTYIYLLIRPFYMIEKKAELEKNESQLFLDDYLKMDSNKLVKCDENIFLEFKQSAYWDEEILSKKEFLKPNEYEHFKSEKHKLIRDQILKAICGMHNAEGGVLVIGVKDDPQIVTGIEVDMMNYDALSSSSSYRAWIVNIVKDHIEEKLSAAIQVKFDHVDNKKIARVNIPRRSESESSPCETTYGKEKVIFKRGDERTIRIDQINILNEFRDRFGKTN